MAITFKYAPPAIRLTMPFEEPYPPQLSYNLQEKTDMLSDPYIIGVWMYEKGLLIGETYGLPLNHTNEYIAGVQHDDTGVYCYSNTVLRPNFGYGSIIKAHWLGLVKGLGYEWVWGHARPGASQALNTKFGAEWLGQYERWQGTEETYRLYRLKL